MGKKEDEKYTSESDRDSQVRSIINQLNAEHPSREKRREVVVRADGTKAVRVVKKRKVMVTRDEKRKRERRQVVNALLIFVLLLGCVFGLVAYRFSQLSSREYYDDLTVKLQESLGARQVQFMGVELNGLQLKVSNVIAEFPEGTMVERLEMSDLSCELEPSSFFTGNLRTEELKIARAVLTVPATAEKVDVPAWNGKELWQIKRMECADFSCVYGDKEAAAVAVQHTTAYLYSPGKTSYARVLMMQGGTFHMAGWRTMQLVEGKLYVTPLALENIRLMLTTDTTRAEGKDPDSYMEISGHLMDGDSLCSALNMATEGMSFSDFTMGRFDRVFTATTTVNPGKKVVPTATIVLPFRGEYPVFGGKFPLKNVRMATMPALMAMMEHIEPVKRRVYLPLKLEQGRVALSNNGGDMQLQFSDSDFMQQDLISMSGDITVNAANEISGSLIYGIPSLLTYVEYPDGNSDPLFRNDGATAWVNTSLSGMANDPKDNIAELEAAAEIARRDRPARTPFENIDVDAFAERVSADAPGSVAPSAGENTEGTTMPANNSGNPFEQNSGNPFDEKPKDPFAPDSNPFGDSSTFPSEGGLTQPADNSIFPSAN